MCNKQTLLYKRVLEVSKYIIETNCTVRTAAKIFGVSKSTIHKDVSERLPKISPTLYNQAKLVLKKNKEERHLRGGLATKLKYLSLETQKNKP